MSTTPSAHRETHRRGGLDPIRLDDLAQPEDNTDLDASTLRHGLLRKLPGGTSDFLRADGAFAAPTAVPGAHASTHENGGSDEIDVTGLSGLLADGQTPLAHATTHEAGGADPIKLDDLAAPDDNTDLDASTSAHGLLKKLPGGTTTFLRADGTFATPSGGAGSADHAWYTYQAAHLEPLAIEKLQVGTFTYAIGSSTTKLLLSAWQTRFGASGRWEMRDPTKVMPLRNVSLIGTGTYSTAAFIDPALASYTDARTTYYDRRNALALASAKYLPLTAPSTAYPLLPGPYGIIIIGTTTFDFTWMALAYDGLNIALAVTNEIGDLTADYQRVTNNAPFPVSKWIGGSILTGVERTASAGKGGVLYVICDSSWGTVTDGTTYIFRDDFMGATLDTGSTWTRSQSTAGNVEINTDYAWCKAKGNSAWGNNGAFTQATTSRSAGKIFECSVWSGDGVGGTGALAPNIIVGWHDGAGHSFSDFSHGIDFTETGGVRALFVFENGTSRGAVGASYSLNTIYRVRITLGASSATYEVQGGPEYAAMGGASWTNITPGTSSSTTTPLAAGFAIADPINAYVGDVKVY